MFQYLEIREMTNKKPLYLTIQWLLGSDLRRNLFLQVNTGTVFCVHISLGFIAEP